MENSEENMPVDTGAETVQQTNNRKLLPVDIGVLSNISKTRKSVSSGYPNLSKSPVC